KKSGVDISHEDVEKVDFFVRTSDFPPILQETEQIQIGKNLFNEIGCNKCHIPSMTTGTSEISALSNKTVFFYSDFLLHDMGQTLSDGVLDGDAKPQEFKTPTLRGLRFFKDFLHDGRAKNVDAAIRMHGGEATTVRNNFVGLSQEERDAIIAFLNSI
ncbi:MAG TPA: di-heme oxidoredictase family protein, partial [bacterium]|nr:di-heme oxidoredictase family protein [bacterium]